jgi:hypothetical protein
VRTAQLKDSTGQVVGGAELFSDLSANKIDRIHSFGI